MRGPRRLPLERLQPYLFESAETPIQWQRIFGNSGPVEIEVGFGKGLFLLTAAQARPDVNFFGIDIERPRQLFTANRLAKRQLGNVRLACTEAGVFLRDRVPAASVQAVHVYFPDPWWKRRHHKRRLFTAEFAAACARVLQEQGSLHVMSDVETYFGIIADLLGKQPRLRRLPTAQPEGDFRTNFERKSRLAGKPIFWASYRAGDPTA